MNGLTVNDIWEFCEAEHVVTIKTDQEWGHGNMRDVTESLATLLVSISHPEQVVVSGRDNVQENIATYEFPMPYLLQGLKPRKFKINCFFIENILEARGFRVIRLYVR